MYGPIHRVSDFIVHTIPKRSRKEFPFVHQVIEFLQGLNALQDDNTAITLSVIAGDGIWITYKGRRVCFVKPAQKFLTHVIWPEAGDVSVRLAKKMDAKSSLFTDTTAKNYYRQWRVHP